MTLSSQERKYLGIIGAIILGLFLMEYNRPQPVNWAKTFSKSDKIPYGGAVVHELLPALFPGQEIVPSRKTFYELSEAGELADVASIIMINDRINLSKFEAEAIADWVENGGKLFMATSEFGGLRDSLGIKVSGGFFFPFIQEKPEGLDSTDIHQFANPSLQKEGGFIFKYRTADYFFQALESQHPTSVLAKNGYGRPTYLRIEYGQGEILWNANPLLFTNYNALLEDNHEYISSALSYLPADGKVLWDEYYKVGRTGSKSQLRVILSKPSLAWAWFMSLVAILVFIIFNAKRRQRVIPIVEPPRNATIEFADTIGRLYLQHRDHAGLAQKMKVHLKDYSKRQLYLYLNELDTPEEAQKLSEKTGLDYDWVKGLLMQLNSLISSPNPTDAQLMNLHQKLEQFYEQSGIRRQG